MKVVSTFHQPSSVAASVRCRLTGDKTLVHLVVAKTNRLEVYSARPEGLHRECTADVWGRVASLKVLPTASGRDNLILMTDHPEPKLAVLTFNVSASGEGALSKLRVVDLQERSSLRHAEFFHDVVVSPSGDVALASCYAGKLKVLVFDDGKLKQEFDVTVSEFNILSLAIISQSVDHHVIAVLHIDHHQCMQLVAHDLYISHYELSRGSSPILAPTSLSTSTFPLGEFPPALIAVPSIPSTQPESSDGEDDEDAFAGGVLIIGGRMILLYELSSREWQDKYRGKQKRLDKQMKDPKTSAGAKERQKERELKRRKATASVEWPWSEVTAWCPANDDGSRYFLGDAYGRLALLSLDSLPKHGLILIPLGQASPPTSLTYITAQMLFLGSHAGDSQLLSVLQSPQSGVDAPTLSITPEVRTLPPSSLMSSNKGKGTVEVRPSEGCVIAAKGQYLEVVDTWKNIAPILDAAVVDTDNSGQPHIVTCSGMKNTGSLRVIRNGADFHEQAVVEGLAKFTHLWPIRKRYADLDVAFLLASDGFEISFFHLSSSDTILYADASPSGFSTASPTLTVGNIAKRTKKPGSTATSYEDSGYVIQVTATQVILLEFDEALQVYTTISKWDPVGESTILHASINASQILLAFSGGKLVVLRLDDTNQFHEIGSKKFEQEIAVISCTPVDNKPYSPYAVVGFWDSNHVQILSLTSVDSYLMPVCEGVTLPALPRSVLLYNLGSDRKLKPLEYQPYLLVGLTDGTVLSYSFPNQELKDCRVTSLGAAPVMLTACGSEGKPMVFASGSRAAVLFWNNGRFQNSPVSLKDSLSSCHLHTPYWKSCLATMTHNGLVIGSVQDLDKMHIHPIPLGLDNPRRIAHDPLGRTFGVACVHSEPSHIGEESQVKSKFIIFDDITFDNLAQFECGNNEEITAIHSLQIRDKLASYYFIGMVTYQNDETEPSAGRLVTVAATKSPASGLLTLEEVASTSVIGCIYAMSSLDGFLAVAINSSVVIYQVTADEKVHVDKTSEWSHNFFVTSLASHGSSLATGDAISSVSVLDFKADRGEKGLETVARDYGPLGPVGLEMWSNTSLIGATSDCNLFSFTVQNVEARRILDRDGSYHLDDLVNKFIFSDWHAQDASQDSKMKLKTFFFTSSGRIGCIIDMEQELALHMSALQRNLSRIKEDIAGTKHIRWRAPVGGYGKTDAEAAYGFLDGDFLEQFLTYASSSADMQKIMGGGNEAEKLDMKQGDIRHVLENLQALH
ncbi:hypothetical protein EVG20_g2619 [Dentipellis fragilis]|uniref:DNA damage-binding protein 1 n=1 Tax=Dentipellis fragilis TaxID=205917 RepID=A0A4Y9Z9B0_9AGAM|nr:hypothetical protein EVG20_g2619 [Dentipellis fragilis]